MDPDFQLTPEGYVALALVMTLVFIYYWVLLVGGMS